jgi:hypothetical protein
MGERERERERKRHLSHQSRHTEHGQYLRGTFKLSAAGNASSAILACRFLSFSMVTSSSNAESSSVIESVGGASKSET